MFLKSPLENPNGLCYSVIPRYHPKYDLGGDNMNVNDFPVIDMRATGNNIRRLRLKRGLTVRDVQAYFGFEEPRAVYKWQNGETLPSVDNLYALSSLLEIGRAHV